MIIDGEAETGVTIMQMNAGLDTGDMLYRKKIPHYFGGHLRNFA